MEFLILWFIAAGMCYLIAEKNGRDVRWAVLWGLLAGFFAVGAYLIIGKKKD